MKNTAPLDPERIRRAAQIYSSNKDAALALGMLANSFARACRRYGIEQPPERQARQQAERRAIHEARKGKKSTTAP